MQIRKMPLSIIPTSIFLALITFTGAMLLSPAAATVVADDEKECTEEMANLAACIPFVSGSAKQPTKECCDNTNKLKNAKPKCLCVLIKDSSDPSLGLPINTTLALQMPAACHIDADVSDCPLLLNLPVDSPEAKMFRVGSSGDSSTSSASNSTTDLLSATAGSDSTKTTSAVTSGGNNEAAKMGSCVLVVVAMGLGFAIFILHFSPVLIY